jgi:hypothetical protein
VFKHRLWGFDAVTCAFVARVGQGGQVEFGGGPVQSGGDVEVFGAGQVV